MLYILTILHIVFITEHVIHYYNQMLVVFVSYKIINAMKFRKKTENPSKDLAKIVDSK